VAKGRTCTLTMDKNMGFAAPWPGKCVQDVVDPKNSLGTPDDCIH